jgi:hypothetical protein
MSETAVATVEARPMSKREWDRYNTLKQEIVNAISASFYAVGKAIAEIQQDELYREEFKTFEQCCQSLFDIGRQRAYQLIGASAVYDQLSTICRQTKLGESDIVIDVLPVNESQIRPLLKVPESDRPLIWAKTVETAPKGKPTNGHVNKVVKKYLGEVTETRIHATRERVAVSRQVNAEMKAALDLVLEEVRKTRREGYKTTSRLAIAMYLDNIRKLVAEDGDDLAENRLNVSNRERLLGAGYIFIRKNAQAISIEKEDRTMTGWQLVGRFDELPAMESAYDKLIRDNIMYLRD